jgi:hypothetical protein
VCQKNSNQEHAARMSDGVNLPDAITDDAQLRASANGSAGDATERGFRFI